MKTHYYSFILYFLVECLRYYRKEQRIIYIFFRETCVHANQIFTDTKLSIDVKSVRRFTTKRQVSGHVRSSNTINALYKRQHHRPIISSQSRLCDPITRNGVRGRTSSGPSLATVSSTRLHRCIAAFG